MDEGEDTYAAFGSALPSISDDEPIRKKPLRIEEQIATDENGRRRFHGAFTGGFSAGFFNTAGSRDGWAPKSFKSSRSALRKEAHNQTPNDFMDDDDRGGFGFAPQGLKTQEAFESRKRDSSVLLKEGTVSCIPGEPVFDQVFVPVRESIGVSLLKGMGWKEGKGIGPKLRKAKKKVIRKAIKRVQPQGTLRHSDDESDEDETFQTKYKDFLFSPDDVPQSVAQPKSNSFGIDYKGLSGAHDFLFGPLLNTTSTAVKFKTKSGALGSIKGQAFGVGAYEEEDDDIYGSTNMSQYDFSLSLENDSPQKKGSRKKSSRWEDDPNQDVIIDGFERAKNTSFVLSRTVYKAPELPRGFKPKTLKRSRFETEKKANPTPSERSSILSLDETKKKEEALLLSDEAIAEIRQLLESNQGGSKASSSEFCPFPDNPSKQKRYDEYLICAKHNRRTLGLRVIHSQSSLSPIEKETETLEFHRTESLFKPLVSSMAAKFVSAHQGDGGASATKRGVSSQVENAVNTKMYGQLTREKVVWHPAPLLCVRFNVKNPYLGKEMTPGSQKSNLFSSVLALEDRTSAERPQDEDKSMKVVQRQVNEKIEEEVLKEKPPIDLFKSIFLDDSSDSEDESEKKEVEEKALQPEAVKAGSSKVATGVFAGIDLDSLVSGPKPPLLPARPPPPPVEKMEVPPEEEPSSCVFGPAKPPSGPSNSYSSKPSDEDLSNWDEKSKSKKSKKSSSSKKKKKKSKKSSKKKKRRRSSSTSSSSDSVNKTE